MKKHFYITTTLPYVNAAPHIGFASEIVIADVVARYHRLLGYEVVFNTGTDEHGQKLYQNALEEGVDPQTYVDRYAAKFAELKDLLNLSYSHFVRTTDAHHMAAAQELWRRASAKGYIYKKEYCVKYCVGCEFEKTDSELDHGKCKFHPNRELENIQEENYFFKWSVFDQLLLDLYDKYPDFVVPKKRLREMRRFVARGLNDFSISRLKEKMPWGVPVPGDDAHVMYVWFDALANYISTLGWPEDGENFEKFWGNQADSLAFQIAGKDNLRQQSAMWQAMLLAADLPTSRKVGINGFIIVDGQKMSKSIGNVISPTALVEKFGIDGTRYVLLSMGAFGEDNDITWKRMIEKYNADLANGLGNLVSRVMKLSEKMAKYEVGESSFVFPEEFLPLIQGYETNEVLERIWDIVRSANKYIEENKPWELVKTDAEKFELVMRKLFDDLHLLSNLVEPFLPETSEKIRAILSTQKSEVLFQRILE